MFDIKPQSIGNAEAYWRDTTNYHIYTITLNVSQTHQNSYHKNGDIAVWDTRHGKYGHVAVCDGVSTTKYFYSYDQNWLIKKMHRVKTRL